MPLHQAQVLRFGFVFLGTQNGGGSGFLLTAPLCQIGNQAADGREIARRLDAENLLHALLRRPPEGFGITAETRRNLALDGESDVADTEPVPSPALVRIGRVG